MDENSVSCSLLLYLKYSWLMSVSVMCLDDTPNPGILSDTPNFHIVTWPHTTFHLPRWLRFATFDDSTQHNTLKFMDIHWYSLYALSPDSIPGAGPSRKAHGWDETSKESGDREFEVNLCTSEGNQEQNCWGLYRVHWHVWILLSILQLKMREWMNDEWGIADMNWNELIWLLKLMAAQLARLPLAVSWRVSTLLGLNPAWQERMMWRGNRSRLAKQTWETCRVACFYAKCS